MRRTRITGAAALLIAGGLALAGCAGVEDAAAPSPADTSAMVGESSPSPDPMSTAEDESSMAPEPSESAAAAEGAYLDYSDGVIESTPGPKALFFHASWCPQCRALDEDLRAAGAPDGLTVFKVDYDSRTDLRQKYGVTLQTTVVFVDDAGDAVSSSVLYDDPSVDSLVAAMP
ncbi:thiol-disulfide isomerase/thioredoxin [Microbacterium sp. AK009]|uniref:thioredoxin family protein n=1 Tax=Microbacterium sp. AK009 TaxID=2723068 RepID=UPI0015CBA001|nr:thioredoxin family protein [Microbacterium sp. AK009]NYF16908.1 thiol-disulfide isomerase/thioredoxin [Microbacterium sp. AK009]